MEEQTEIKGPFLLCKMQPQPQHPCKKKAWKILRTCEGCLITTSTADKVVVEMNRAIGDIYRRWNSQRPVNRQFPVPEVRLVVKQQTAFFEDTDYHIYAICPVAKSIKEL